MNGLDNNRIYATLVVFRCAVEAFFISLPEGPIV